MSQAQYSTVFGLFVFCFPFAVTLLGLMPRMSDGLCLFPLFLQTNGTGSWPPVAKQPQQPNSMVTSAASASVGDNNDFNGQKFTPLTDFSEQLKPATAASPTRDWRGGIQEQGTRFSVRLVFDGSTVSWLETESGAVAADSVDPWITIHRRECIETTDGDKYLVRHQDLQATSTSTPAAGQPTTPHGRMEFDNRYSDDDNNDDYHHHSDSQFSRRSMQHQVFHYACVQFIRRSSNVIQLRTSPVADRKDIGLCADDKMTTDRRLFVDYASEPESEASCSLRGGFSTRMVEARSRTTGVVGGAGAVSDTAGVCGDARLESDCDQGSGGDSDGMHFHFRSPTCVPHGLYMYANQRTICMASWSDSADRYSYVALRHDRLEYRWLLRYPAVLVEDTFVAHLFADLNADDVGGDHATPTTSRGALHWRVDAVRDVARPVTSLCVDESEACHVWNAPSSSLSTAVDSTAADRRLPTLCARQMALACPRSCGICNESRPVVCSFRPDLVGSWIAMTEPGEPALTVTFNSSTVTFAATGLNPETFYCVTWSASGSRSSSSAAAADEVMLVTEHFDGCRPRYACIRHQRRSSTLLQLRLSHRRSWPLISAADQPIDCRSFSYDPDDDLSVGSGTNNHRDRFRHQRLFYSREQRDPVPCRLPPSVGRLTNYTMIYADGSQCLRSGFAVEFSSTTEGTRFQLTVGTCSSSTVTSTHAATSPMPPRRTAEYLCAKSSRLGPTPNSDGVVVVARSVELPVDVQCLIAFEKPEPEVYWLRANECVMALRRQLRRDRISPLAVLSSLYSRKSDQSRRSDDDVIRRMNGRTDVTRSPPSPLKVPHAFGRTVADDDADDVGNSSSRIDEAPEANGAGTQQEMTVSNESVNTGNATTSELVPETTNAFVLFAAVVVFILLHIPCNFCHGGS
jgi:hypothetical protein